MAQTLACLRGWHVGLAQAELVALFTTTKFEELSPRLMLTSQQPAKELQQSLSCSSGIQCFLRDVELINYPKQNQTTLLEKVSRVLEKFPMRGSLAV